jgi:hypothetical protein
MPNTVGGRTTRGGMYYALRVHKPKTRNTCLLAEYGAELGVFFYYIALILYCTINRYFLKGYAEAGALDGEHESFYRRGC